MDTLFGFSFSKLIKLAKKKRQRERKLNQTPRRIRLGLSKLAKKKKERKLNQTLRRIPLGLSKKLSKEAKDLTRKYKVG